MPGYSDDVDTFLSIFDPLIKKAIQAGEQKSAKEAYGNWQSGLRRENVYTGDEEYTQPVKGEDGMTFNLPLSRPKLEPGNPVVDDYALADLMSTMADKAYGRPYVEAGSQMFKAWASDEERRFQYQKKLDDLAKDEQNKKTDHAIRMYNADRAEMDMTEEGHRYHDQLVRNMEHGVYDGTVTDEYGKKHPAWKRKTEYKRSLLNPQWSTDTARSKSILRGIDPTTGEYVEQEYDMSPTETKMPTYRDLNKRGGRGDGQGGLKKKDLDKLHKERMDNGSAVMAIKKAIETNPHAPRYTVVMPSGIKNPPEKATRQQLEQLMQFYEDKYQNATRQLQKAKAIPDDGEAVPASPQGGPQTRPTGKPIVGRHR